MKKETNSSAYITIGIILLVISLAVFILVNDSKAAIDWIGLLFILLAEVIFIGGVITINEKVKRQKVFITAGVLSTLSIYLVLTILVSNLFWFVFRGQANLLIALQMILVAFTAIICILIKIFAGKSKDND